MSETEGSVDNCNCGHDRRVHVGWVGSCRRGLCACPNLRLGATPCRSELWSWDHFRSEQVDPYWMRCHRVGEHDEHEHSETRATWLTGEGTMKAANK